MNKILMVLSILAVLAFVPAVIAEEAVIDGATVKETEAMLLPLGAEVRLLQLEKSIFRNVLVAEKVISVLEKNHPEADLTAPKATLAELKALLSQVQDSLKDINSKEKTVLVTEFVSMKKNAISLTKQFKDQTKNLITASDRTAIHDAIKNEFPEISQLKNRINQRIRAFNAERVRDTLKAMNISDEELVNQIRDGNLSKNQIRTRMMASIGKIPSGERKRLMAEIVSNNIKRKMTHTELMNRIRANPLNDRNYGSRQESANDRNSGSGQGRGK